MTGFVYVGSDIQDFGVAEELARSNVQDAHLFLDIIQFCDSPRQSSFPTKIPCANLHVVTMVTGTFRSALPGGPHMVTRGTFGLFTVEDRAPDTRSIVYEFDMIGIDGIKLHFHGIKLIDNAAAFRVTRAWQQTTTLFVTVTRREKSRSVAARGVLRIKASDLLNQLFTLDVSGLAKRWTLAGFVGSFAKNVARSVLAPVLPFGEYASVPIGKSACYETRPGPIGVIHSYGLRRYCLAHVHVGA